MGGMNRIGAFLILSIPPIDIRTLHDPLWLSG